MIDITKAEAATIRAKYPGACIVQTVHRRCVEESERYLRLIPDNIEAAAILAEIDSKRKSKYVGK